MQNIHIGFLTPEYPNGNHPEGGLGNYIRKTAYQLVESGCYVTIFTLSDQTKIISGKGISIYYIKKFRPHWRLKRSQNIQKWTTIWTQYFNAYRMKNAVLNIHKYHPISILQTSNYKTPGIHLLNNNLFPVVCRCSSYSPLLRAASGQQRFFPDLLIDWMEIQQVVGADATFAPSLFIASTLKRFEAVETCVIRTPLEPPNFNEQDFSEYNKLVKDEKYLLYFGTLSGVKGTDILIKVAPKFLSENNNLKLVFIGRNDLLPNGKNALSEIITKLSGFYQDGRIIYSDRLTQNKLYPIIKNALGVVIPSRVDNYPNACLEAMMLGVPVVGTYNSSLDEMISEGQTGFLSNNDDPESLSLAIERLLSMDEVHKQKMRKNIQASIKLIIAEDRIGQLLDFYFETVAKFSLG